jgi:hypothetical protein
MTEGKRGRRGTGGRAGGGRSCYDVEAPQCGLYTRKGSIMMPEKGKDNEGIGEEL